LIARMPQMGAKLLRIQHDDRTSDELEKLDRQTQFETGLTGTPHATDRSIYSPKYAMRNSEITSISVDGSFPIASG
jgi:hypothetical protein